MERNASEPTAEDPQEIWDPDLLWQRVAERLWRKLGQKTKAPPSPDRSPHIPQTKEVERVLEVADRVLEDWAQMIYNASLDEGCLCGAMVNVGLLSLAAKEILEDYQKSQGGKTEEQISSEQAVAAYKMLADLIEIHNIISAAQSLSGDFRPIHDVPLGLQESHLRRRYTTALSAGPIGFLDPEEREHLVPTNAETTEITFKKTADLLLNFLNGLQIGNLMGDSLDPTSGKGGVETQTNLRLRMLSHEAQSFLARELYETLRAIHKKSLRTNSVNNN